MVQYQLRPMQLAASFLTSAVGETTDSLDGGRASRASSRVVEAARRGSRKPRPGGEMVGNKLRIHIDDPGAGAAFAGSHPTQQRSRLSSPSKVGRKGKKTTKGIRRKR